jgi:hypothetical protein
MEEFYVLKCPESFTRINREIKQKFINKFNNDGIQLRILDEENEDDNIYNYTAYIENNFCGLDPLMSPNYIKNSVLEDENFALIKFLNYDDIHSIITFKIMNDYDKNLKYIYVDAYCVNKVKKYFGAGILLDYLVYVCKNIQISEIRLDAILRDETINFYLKKGFNEISSNSSYAKMVKIINGGFKNKNKNKNKKYTFKKTIIKNKNKNKKYNFRKSTKKIKLKNK